MCGRYAASRHADQLVEVFEVDEVVREEHPGETAAETPEWLAPRWNIAPTQDVAAVLERVRDDEVTRKLVGLRWGLVPSWAKDPSGGARMINARLETVAEKPSFRKAFRTRRCLIPADGYYEWYASTQPGAGAKTSGAKTSKQPFYIHPVGEGGPEGAAGASTPLMAMAGIYEFWRDPARERDDPDAWLTSCSIITTSASDDLGRIHDRMPVQVARADWDAWLDPSLTDADAALGLLHAPGPGAMGAYAVSRLVSNVRNEGAELVAPLAEEPT